MTRDSRRVFAVTGLISAALAGLLVLQVLLLAQSYRQKLSIFRQRAGAALLGVVEKLETLETLNRVMALKLSPAGEGETGRIGVNIAGKSADPGAALPAAADPFRAAMVGKVLEQYLDIDKKSVAERIPAGEMDRIVELSVRGQQIAIPYEYGILRTDRGDFIKAVPAGGEDRLRASEFRTRFYPHDLQPQPYDLVLNFPDQERAVLAGMAVPAAAAAVFLLITAGGFVFTLSALARGRRFSSRLTDFINNMAHAFKTPLSTLSLAGSSLVREDAGEGGTPAARFGRIVLEESERLRRQTERILEMASLERRDAGLALRPVDMHDLIGRAVGRFIPEAEKRKGTIRFNPGAPISRLEADETHWQGVFDNLLDNAFRYNRRPPEVAVETSGTDTVMRIVVSDNGIGIPPRDLPHVFDKYFRVAAGLKQETPGFGLGLSYVRWVVEAHGGTVEARSRLDEGSEFEVTLPLGKGAARKRRGVRRRPKP